MTFVTSPHGALWLSLSSTPNLDVTRLSSVYKSLHAGIAEGGATVADTSTFDSISRDVGRTFSLDAPAGSVNRLRRVLTALAVYDRSIGYVQGLNFLAAFALLHVATEEEAFALIVRLLNGPRYGMAALYRERLHGVRTMARVLDEILRRSAPAAAAALQRAGASALFYFEWHFSLFTLVLPAPLAADVWDVVFRDGFAPAAHRAVLVLMRELEPHLVRAPGAHETLALLKSFARARAAGGGGLGGGDAPADAPDDGARGAAGGLALNAPADLIARMGEETHVTLDLVARLTAEAAAVVDTEDALGRARQRSCGGASGAATAAPRPPATVATADAMADAALGVAAFAGLTLLGFGAALALRAARRKR
jgi:hypothetical protein